MKNLIRKILKEEEDGLASWDWTRDALDATNDIGRFPIKRVVTDHKDMMKYGRGTKWWPAIKQGEGTFYSYVDKYGSFEIYINHDDTRKVACVGDAGCFKENDEAVSREEAGKYIGLPFTDNLDDITERKDEL